MKRTTWEEDRAMTVQDMADSRIEYWRGRIKFWQEQENPDKDALAEAQERLAWWLEAKEVVSE